jgi:hypothetical protein
MNRAESKHDGSERDGNSTQDDLGDIAAIRSFKFAKQNAAPEQTDERIRIP